MTMPKAKKMLASVWYVGGGIMFVLVGAWTIGGKYSDIIEDIWSWFLPSVLPTLLLITGVFVADAQTSPRKSRMVQRFMIVLALCLSVFYLLAVATVLFSIPFSSEEPLALLKKAGLGLGPLQGLVGACLGLFFVRKD